MAKHWAQQSKRKKNIFLQIAAFVIIGFAFMLVVNSDHAWGQTQLRQSVERKFEEYRRAIKDSYQVDIKNFKDNLKGGYGDGKTITAYDLEQLLAGIKVEMEHTSNTFVALELAMDHLERIRIITRGFVSWREYTSLTALGKYEPWMQVREQAMDHLERIPDYYTHLVIWNRGMLMISFGACEWDIGSRLDGEAQINV